MTAGELTNPLPSLNFGGQSLIVELRTEGMLFGGSPTRAPESDRAGGEHLNAVLGRALDDSFTYLRHLDPYGNTVFSRIQMPAVLPELDRLMEFARNDNERRAISGVIELAQRCSEHVHTYLVFIGD
jgi:hypothetical protein